MAASGPSPYAAARLLSTSEVTIRKPAWSSSPTPTPKTGFSTAGDSVNHRGARLMCSLCRCQPDGEVGDDDEVREPGRQRRAGDAPVQHEDEQDVEHDVGDGGGDEPDHHLARGALGPHELLETERRGEHGDEGEHDGDEGARRGHRGGIRTEQRHERVQQEQPDAAEHGPDDHRAPHGERRDVLDLAGLRGVVLCRAEQPRDERAAADAEHAADRHDQAEQRRAERDRGEERGVVRASR